MANRGILARITGESARGADDVELIVGNLQALLNTRGMMWRKVPQDVKDAIDESSAIRLMLDTPSIIRRPVLDVGGKRHVGFQPDAYGAIFDRHDDA